MNVERKRQNEGTTYNEKDENDGRVTQTKQKNVEECCHREQNSATITQGEGMKRVKKRRENSIFIYAERQQKNIEYVHYTNTIRCVVGTDK